MPWMPDAQYPFPAAPVSQVEGVLRILHGLLENSEDRVVPLLENCTKCYDLAITDAIVEINKRCLNGTL